MWTYGMAGWPGGVPSGLWRMGCAVVARRCGAVRLHRRACLRQCAASIVGRHPDIWGRSTSFQAVVAVTIEAIR